MWTTDSWKDYELLDASDGERLERWPSAPAAASPHWYPRLLRLSQTELSPTAT